MNTCEAATFTHKRIQFEAGTEALLATMESLGYRFVKEGKCHWFVRLYRNGNSVFVNYFDTLNAPVCTQSLMLHCLKAGFDRAEMAASQ